MGKVNLLVKYCLRNQEFEYNIKGIYQNNKIKYNDETGIVVIDLNNNILERYSNNEKIIFDFNNKKCYIDSLNVFFDINVINFINEKNKFYVKYKLENDSFEIKIEIVI